MTIFTLQDREYEYFCHPFNDTRHNERAVEIPIICTWVSDIRKTNPNIKILELGNTLQHYYLFPHDIVDKEEGGIYLPVINKDIVDYHPDCKYDVIFSISTIEHVGREDDGNDKYKIVRALSQLTDMLNVGGKIFVTFPIGFHPDFDSVLKEGKIPFTKVYCLHRDDYNSWIEDDFQRVLKENDYLYEACYLGTLPQSSVAPYATEIIISYTTCLGIGIIEKGGKP